MEICKAPTLRFKGLNKHSITHIMYIEMENVISKKKRRKKRMKNQLKYNVDINRGSTSSITMQKMHAHAFMHAHTHTHALYRLIGVKDKAA